MHNKIPKIGAIIQARTSSSRLPYKVLKELPFGSGITVLSQVIRRLKRSKRLNEIVIATTEEKQDDVIVDIASKEKATWFRGSKENVLERYYLAARQAKHEIIVRITSDCPCIDPVIVDLVIDRHIESNADYTATPKIKTYPVGLAVEVFNFDILEVTNKNAAFDFEKEHVTPYIYMNPDKFRIVEIKPPEQLDTPDIRITLDVKQDYILLCAVFDYLYPKNKNFTVYDIVSLFKEKPWLKLINSEVIQKKICNALEDELKEAISILDMQDLKKARDFINSHLSKEVNRLKGAK